MGAPGHSPSVARRLRPRLSGPAVSFLALTLGFVLLGGFVGLHASEAFLPPQSTVILLPGLPGDVESETSYREQLQGWLDWFGGQDAPPRRLCVFWDNPESLALPKKLEVTVAPARREEFMSLSRTLTGQTNPIVVIAWGHGGLQGQTPVFHVRGPRITPADLKSFADQLAGVESRWVLYFRGSGRFANEIAGANRQIVSSESGALFTSDPIGLPLLLRAARAYPTNSFVSIAEELGRAVVVWYESRNLARTEQPTLWLPGEDSKSLVPAGTTSAVAAAEPKMTPVTAPAQPARSAETSAELPAVWQELGRADPRHYADADAVVLRRRISFTLGAKPALTGEREQFVQILTAEGKHFGDFDVAYSPPQEELEFLDCEVLRPDGKLVRLNPDDIRDNAEAAVGDYRTARRKFFSLPGVMPGAVLHVRYRTQWTTYPLPHISLTVPLADATPIRDSLVEVTVAENAAFHFAFEHTAPADPTVKQTTHGSRYTWHFQETPARTKEVLAPALLQPALLISTWPDWPAFAEWYARVTKLADELTPELSAKAKELTRDSHSDREKARALYDYVARLRYVAVPLGVNSFRPHAAAQVFQNQFGDCKDKANLFNTLLRSLGLDACLVLVPRFSQAHEAVPGLAFNHAISRVTLGNETMWVDTTDDVCRFGMLPPGDAGRRVLVIDGHSTNLTLLPLPATQDHRLELNARVTCATGGEPAPTTLEVKTFGFPDYEFRGIARGAREHGRNLPLLAAQLRLSAGAFSMSRQSSTPVSKLDEDFSWQGEGQCLGLVSGDSAGWRLRAPVWLPKEWDLALHPRATPLLLNQGYPLALDEEIEVLLPAGAKQVKLPPAQSSNREPLRWAIDWNQTDGQTLRVHFHVELSRGELSAGEVPELQKQLRALLTFLANEASFASEP